MTVAIAVTLHSAWTTIHAQLHTLLKRQRLLPNHCRILVALSGGQDSLCLLRLLLDLQPKWDWTLATVHCDHRWPPDSGDNAAHVAQLSQQWQLEHFALIASQVLKGEAEGRDWRYQEMADCAQHHHFSHVVTAHTASDRAETLLYHLIRGSGMEGLQAMSQHRPLNPSVTLVRPILHLTRVQTGQFCQNRNLPVWQDAMNQDLHYRRNRIRLKVLPYLREHFNPQVDQAIAQTSELLQADVAYLNVQAQAVFNQVSPDALRLDRERLKQAPLALQRRVIRIFLQRCLKRSPDFAQVQKLMTLLDGNHRDRTDSLFRGVVAEVKREWIILHDPHDPNFFDSQLNPEN